MAPEEMYNTLRRNEDSPYFHIWSAVKGIDHSMEKALVFIKEYFHCSDSEAELCLMEFQKKTSKETLEMIRVISTKTSLYHKMNDFLKADDFQGGVAYLKEFFHCDDALAKRCLMEFKENSYDVFKIHHSTEEWKRREAAVELEVRARERKQQTMPKCPTCGSTDLKKISGTAKAAGALTFGLFSKTARSQFQCKNCGYKW